MNSWKEIEFVEMLATRHSIFGTPLKNTKLDFGFKLKDRLEFIRSNEFLTMRIFNKWQEKRTGPTEYVCAEKLIEIASSLLRKRI